jgi:hypothetical protein
MDLFAFLIPVAVVWYMRAYFWGVKASAVFLGFEASEVTTRIRMEEIRRQSSMIESLDKY